MTGDRVYEGVCGGVVRWHDRVSGMGGELRPEGLSLHEPVQLYEWGRPGLGAHFTALALLIDALESQLLPGLWAEQFAAQVVAGLPAAGWTLTRLQVFGWLIQQLEEELCGPLDPDQVPRADWCVTGLTADEAADRFLQPRTEDSDNAKQ